MSYRCYHTVQNILTWQNTNYKSRNQIKFNDWTSLSCQTDCQQGRVSDLWHYQQPQQKANSPVSQANAIRWQYSRQIHNFSTFSYARRSRKIGNQKAVSHSAGVQPVTASIKFTSTGWHWPQNRFINCVLLKSHSQSWKKVQDLRQLPFPEATLNSNENVHTE